VVLLLHYQKARETVIDDCGLVGESDVVDSVRTMLGKVAMTDLPVLLLGESGTGKELVARAIHERSERSAAAMVSVNMAAIPDELAASELFGVRRGAYTGADSDRPGYFQKADAGTLFLDEIGDCAPSVQTQLLRVLQEGEVQPPGGNSEKVDVRVIAATDAELSGREFSSALKHRLGGFEIHMPPLRNRREDIGRLMVHMLPGSLLEEIAMDPVVIGQWAMLVHDFALYHWPGNVRELGNFCQQIAIASDGTGQLTVPDHVFGAIRNPAPAEQRDPEHPQGSGAQPTDAEIKNAMLAARWEVARAARELKISRQSLYKRIARIPDLRVAADIPVAEVEAVYHECKGELREAALRLQVSRTALGRRWRSLELTAQDY
jgi:two-component system nitrogen regulation response regulator GlnG